MFCVSPEGRSKFWVSQNKTHAPLGVCGELLWGMQEEGLGKQKLGKGMCKWRRGKEMKSNSVSSLTFGEVTE